MTEIIHAGERKVFGAHPVKSTSVAVDSLGHTQLKVQVLQSTLWGMPSQNYKYCTWFLG